MVHIVGAGPGAADLLTVKAYRIIEQADVILYDALISDEILAINTNAEQVYAGKRFGDKCNQEDRQLKINEQMVVLHQAGKKVVRLKSGDPYVYGRAAEEAIHLVKHEVPFEVIPGISAGLAAANILNLPITQRKKSNAITICTAHTADYSFEQLNGLGAMLKAGNTLVLYMGFKSLDKLAPKLIEVTKNPLIPIHAISKVSSPDQVLVSGTLENIQDELIKTPLETPVVFIVGCEKIGE